MLKSTQLMIFSFALLAPAFAAGCSASTEDPAEDVGIDTEEVTAGFTCSDNPVEVGFGDPNNPDTWDFGESTFAAARAAGRPEVGFDRFVLEFKPGSKIARYRVAKQNSAKFHLGESEESVTLKGNAGLSVMLWLGGNWTEANPQPSRFDVRNGSMMREAMMNYLFEGDMGWGIGLQRANACYRVFKLAGPPRLVIDVKR